MSESGFGKAVGTVREGVADAGERAHEVVEELADRIEDALDHATVKGRRIQKKVRAELGRRWKQVDSAGRENAFAMALGALGVGILIGYLISQDRD